MCKIVVLFFIHISLTFKKKFFQSHVMTPFSQIVFVVYHSADGKHQDDHQEMITSFKMTLQIL